MKTVLFFFTILFIANISFAQETALSSQNASEMTVTNGEATLTSTVIDQVKASKVSQILTKLKLKKDTNVIISTDSEKVTEETLNWTDKNKESGDVSILPIGKLLKKSKDNVISRTLVNYKNHFKNSIKNDRVGLLIISAVTAYDSFLWIHATDYGIEQRSAIITFNIAMAIAFGINKDNWAYMVRGTEKGVKKLTGMASLYKKSETVGIKEQLLTNFLVNTSLSVGIQLTRASLLSFDHLAASVSQASFWGTSLLLGTALSFSTFAWSEHMVNINENSHPIAKTLSRRLMEIRAFSMGYLAPSSKLMQPGEFGMAPWLFLIGHGAIGLLAWSKTQILVSKIEQSKFLNSIIKKYKSSKIKFAESIKKIKGSGATLSCKSLLLN